MLTRFLALLLLVFTASAQTPSVSHARQPIAEPVKRPGVVAFEPYITTNGDEFLAVWNDDRYGNTDIYGARLDAEGELIDRSGFPVHATWRPDYASPAVWDGQRYLTLAPSEHMGTFPLAVEEDGHTERAGELFPAHLGFHRSLAWNGQRYAAVMGDGTANTISFVLLSHQLRVETSTPLPAGDHIRLARVAAGGGGFLLVWESIRGDSEDLLYAWRFSASGESLGAPQLLASLPIPEQFDGFPERYLEAMKPAVSWNGNAFVVVWTTPGGVHGARIAEGAPETFRLTTESNPTDAAIAWDGVSHLVLWNRDMRLDTDPVQPYAAVVSGTGQVLDTFAVGPEQDWHRPMAVASNGRIFLLLAYGEKFVIRPSSTPRVKEELFSSEIYLPQRNVAIAVGTSNVLAAWHETGAVYAGRLSRGGSPLDGGGIRVAGVGSWLDSMRIASNGDTYLLVWEEADRGVRGARVTEAGELLDAHGFDIAPGGRTPIVAARGDSFLVAWRQQASHPLVTRIFTSVIPAAIPAGGAVEIDPKGLTADIGLSQQPIALLADSGGFRLVWHQQLSPPCYGRFCTYLPFEERLTTLGADGAVAEEKTLVRNQAVDDAVLLDDTLVAVVRNGPSFFSHRFNLAGEALGTPSELAIPGNAIEVRIVKSAGGATVLYTPQATPSPTGSGRLEGETRAIFLDGEGTPKASPALVLSGSDTPRISDVAFDGAHVWLAYSTRWYPSPQTHTGTVERAYVAKLAGRVRAARR
ncbi:MAG TPA: hypothetical protein VEK57_25940 [Thermoanaerobaculia bacterium]|nr:hypothetical protein [Thermoanaerobaculia bacterium]